MTDGVPFSVEVSYLEGAKGLAIDGRPQPCDARASSYEAVLATLAPPQLAVQRERVAQVRAERERLIAALSGRAPVRKIWPSATNFLLVDFTAPDAVLEAARAAKLLIRDMRAATPGALRITVGSPEQNDRLIRSLA